MGAVFTAPYHFPLGSWNICCGLNHCCVLMSVGIPVIIGTNETKCLWLTHRCQNKGHNLHFNPGTVMKPAHTFLFILPPSVHFSEIWSALFLELMFGSSAAGFMTLPGDGFMLVAELSQLSFLPTHRHRGRDNNDCHVLSIWNFV